MYTEQQHDKAMARIMADLGRLPEPKQETAAQTLTRMIRKAADNQDKAQLMALDARTANHYNLGTISAAELTRLDGLIMDKLAQLA